MATITPVEPAAKDDRSAHAETRLLLKEVPWHVYEALRESEANNHVRMTYDEGDLELMSPSQRHEEYGGRFTFFLMAVAEALGFKCKPLAATTWKVKDEKKGKEADACFYLANYERVRGKEIDLRVDPPPDLAVEVEISRSAIDALNVYAALGVPEVWRFDGDTFRIHVRQADGSYVERDVSPSLPFLRPDEVVRWMERSVESDDDVEWIKQVREWARVELAPRLTPG